MTAPISRRRLSFGLRTMLVGVTVAAVLCFIGTRFLPHWLNPDLEFSTGRQLSNTHFVQIWGVIEKSPRVTTKHPVSSLTEELNGSVTVNTGISGSHQEWIMLERRKGTWTIVNVLPKKP